LTLHTPKRAAYITTITSPSLHVSRGPATRDTIVSREVTCPELRYLCLHVCRHRICHSRSCEMLPCLACERSSVSVFSAFNPMTRQRLKPLGGRRRKTGLTGLLCAKIHKSQSHESGTRALVSPIAPNENPSFQLSFSLAQRARQGNLMVRDVRW
jgi:hypothetical protein